MFRIERRLTMDKKITEIANGLNFFLNFILF